MKIFKKFSFWLPVVFVIFSSIAPFIYFSSYLLVDLLGPIGYLIAHLAQYLIVYPCFFVFSKAGIFLELFNIKSPIVNGVFVFIICFLIGLLIDKMIGKFRNKNAQSNPKT